MVAFSVRPFARAGSAVATTTETVVTRTVGTARAAGQVAERALTQGRRTRAAPSLRPRTAMRRTFTAKISSVWAAVRAPTGVRLGLDPWTHSAWFVAAVLLGVAIGLLAIVLTDGGMQ
jgi:hypothetical protein